MRALLHPEFVELPLGLLTSRRSLLSRPTIVDIRAVGPVVTVDMRVDWRLQPLDGEEEIVLRRLPVQLQLHRAGGGDAAAHRCLGLVGTGG